MKKQIFLGLTIVFFMAGTAAAQKSFHNKKFKFGFRAPAGSKLKTDADSLYAEPPLKGLIQVSLVKPGRGLYDATATVSAANTTKDECRALSTAEEDKPRRKKFGTTTFYKTEFVEGGMESVHPVENYRTFHRGVCYEVRIMVGMEKYPKRPVKSQAVFTRLYTILRTLYFR